MSRVGDSHSRRLVLTVLTLFCDAKNVVDWPWNDGTNPFKMSNDSAFCPGFQVYMFDNINLCMFQSDFLASLHITNSTFMSLNCGHHAASHHHFTHDQYRYVVERSTNMVKKRGLHPSQFAWLESTAFPLVDYLGVATHQDWRTQHRLSMFNDIANEIALRKKMNIIKTFDVVLPFIEYSTCTFILIDI